MHLDDISFYRQGPILGHPNSLTVVTDTPEVSSHWVLEHLADKSSLFIYIGRDEPKVAGDSLDASFCLLQPNKVAQLEIRARETGKTRIILQYPDLFTAAGQAASSVISLVQKLLKFAQVIVAVQISEALESELPVSRELDALVTLLLYQSSLVLAARPFLTGRADDITGTFSVSGGPRALEVQPQEFFYTVGRQVVLELR